MKTVNKFAVVSVGLVAAVPAFANIDVTDVASSLQGLVTPIGLVGAAYLAVRIAVRGWKIIRSVV